MATFRKANSCRIAAAFAALGGLAIYVPAASAQSVFTVNAPTDGSDDNPGDGFCATSSGACTLRAAIEETNVLVGMDVINLPAGEYLIGDPMRGLPVSNPLSVLDSLSIIGAGAEQSIIDGAADTPVMHMQRVEALVIDSTSSGPDGVGVLRVPNGASVGGLPFISPASGTLDFAVDVVRGGFEVDRDLLAISITQGVLRYDVDTGAFVGVHIEPTLPSGTLSAVAIAGGLPPTALAGDLLVSNFQTGGGVVRFNGSTGDFVSEFVPAGSGGLAFPGGMLWKSFFQQGRDLLVVSTGSHSVLRYDEDGSFVGTFAAGGLLSTPRDIVQQGTSVYVTSEGADAVLQYDGETGAFLGEFVPAGSGGLDEPTDLEFGPDGDLYVRSGGTQQILRYDGQTGDFKAVFAEAGSQGLDFIGGFTLVAGRAGIGPIVSASGITIANGDSVSGGLTAGLTVARGVAAMVFDSTIRDNNSSITGGGIQNDGNLTMFNVAVTGNVLPHGPGAGGGQTSTGGGIFTNGFLTLERCLIANNTSIRGGGINVNSGSVDITNTTISGNNADGAGGGLRIVGGHVDLNFSTITSNTANLTTDESTREGGGVYVFEPFGLSVANSIIAGNIDAEAGFVSDAGFSPDCFTDPGATITSFRDNLIGILDASNCSIGDTIFGDLSFIQWGTPAAPLDARLLSLVDNGGPTLTHALATSSPASPALDADLAVTSATFFDCPAVDQRGSLRPSGPECDIGAYEVQLAPPESFLPASSTAGCTGAANCTAESWGIDLNADTGYLWNVDGGTTGGSADLFLRVAVLSGTRAMGLRVNGTQVAVISTDGAASPRPVGSEFGSYTVTLNPGNNTVELVDNQGTEEFDVHYLRVESSQGVCGNNVCASSESCASCPADCGQCGVVAELQFAQSVLGCTGAANCTEESWGIDLNGGTGYQWTVSGGEAGGAVNLFAKVAVPSGSRSMGLFVNGNQIAVVSTNSTQSPRPDGTEFGPFFVTLNPGDNTVEWVDNQGTAEFDVHYLRIEPTSMPGTPCSSFCSNSQMISWSGSYQGGNLGTGAICLETTQPVAGGNCGNFASGRQLFLNGAEMPCNVGNWTSLPASVNGGYCVEVTPGNESYAFVTLW